MKRISKPTPIFKNNVDVEDIMGYYNTSYPPPAKQLSEDNFADDGIDIPSLDPQELLLNIRATRLSTKIWLVETIEDVNKMLDYFSTFDTLSFDSETTNIKLATPPDVIMWSFAVKVNETFVVPYTFNDQVLEYLTTTTQNVVAHNLGFDEKIIHRMTGKFLKNRQDTFLLMYALLNDSRKTPKLSLKEQTKSTFGYWATSVEDLQLSDATNEELIYYAGIDAVACLFLFNQHKEKILATPKVDIFHILPSKHPSNRAYTRYWFYKNVALNLVPVTIAMMNTGLPLNMDRVHELDAELDSILGKADEEVLKLPTVLKCFEQFKKDKAGIKRDKYLERIDVNKVKIYKPTNQQYINLFVTTMYPQHKLPSKAKNWTPTVISTFDTTLASAIKNKSLESLRDTVIYSSIFQQVEEQLTNQKIVERTAKVEEVANNTYLRAMLDLEFKPLASAAQKKYILNKGFNISSNTKSMTSGEDSFNREELTRLSRELDETSEAHKYIEMCLLYSGGAIIKNNFLKNFKEFALDGTIYANFRLASTKTFRLAGGGNVNMLALPSSRSPYSKPIKRCITVPSNDWVWITGDYQALT